MIMRNGYEAARPPEERSRLGSHRAATVGFCLPADQRVGPGDQFIAAELAELRRANEILKAAAIFFGAIISSCRLGRG